MYRIYTAFVPYFCLNSWIKRGLIREGGTAQWNNIWQLRKCSKWVMGKYTEYDLSAGTDSQLIIILLRCQYKPHSHCFLYTQGEAVLFVVTNFLETPNQKLGYCAEVRTFEVVHSEYRAHTHMHSVAMIGAVKIIILDVTCQPLLSYLRTWQRFDNHGGFNNPIYFAQ